ncbi:MAG: glycosyltransferase family 87 protein [Actinocrinis sp.]
MTVSPAAVDDSPKPRRRRARERAARPATPLVVTAPTLDDPVANVGADGIGGVLGRRARLPRSRAAMAFLLLVLTLLSTAVGIGMREPCFNSSWTGGGGQQYTHMCYTDVPFMYQGRGFVNGETAYYSTNPNNYLEYPVITGAAMETAALLARHVPGDANNQGRWFYVFTTWFLLAFAAITVLALIGISGPRPWDAMMFAVAPGLMLNGTINWDLIAVGLAAVALLAWARRKPVVAGVFIGLGTAAKLYPALLLVALVLLCWRAGKMRDWGLCVFGAVGAWLVVNLPFMIENWHSWTYFYTFNESRGADWGSLWLFLQYSPLHLTVSPHTINVAFAVLLALSCVGIGLITWLARNRPRVAQVAFLVAAAFILFNKVYSPQYVLWLIPLAVLARPRWRDFLIWQACEVFYYGAVWLYLVTLDQNSANRGLPQGGYDTAIAIHILGTLFFVAQVIRDMFDTRRDPIRAGGHDDPGGGVLDQAADVYGFRDLFPADGSDKAGSDEGRPWDEAQSAAERESEVDVTPTGDAGAEAHARIGAQTEANAETAETDQGSSTTNA